MNKFLMAACALLLFVAGCAHLNPDLVGITTENANYPTVLLNACGKYWNGLGICNLAPGTDYASVQATVQTFYNGHVRITSESCGIDVSQDYTNSAVVPIPLTGKAKQNCIVTVTVSPTYPTQSSNDLVVSPLVAYLYIQVTPTPWIGSIRKVPSGFRSNWNIMTSDTKQVTVKLQGCGINYSQPFIPVTNVTTISIQDAVSTKALICALAGELISQEFITVQLGMMVAVYDTRMIPLPIPITTISGTTLTVQADPSVSVIFLDNAFAVANGASYNKVDWTKPHVLGIVTVIGRATYGVWDAANGRFKWLQ